MNYAAWEAVEGDGNGAGGGFSVVSNEHPAGQVLACIDSDDIEADLRKVERLGGARAPKGGKSRLRPVRIVQKYGREFVCVTPKYESRIQ